MLLRTLKSLFLSSNKEAAEPIEARVLRLLRERRPEQARTLLIPFIACDDPSPQLVALMGEVEYHLKNPVEAERLSLVALRKKPGVAGAHYVLSLIHYDAGKYEEALTQAQYAMNCSTGDARILAQVGLCCIALNKYTPARDTLRQAVLLEPDNVPALNNLGIAHHAVKENDKALYHFQRALALNPAYEPARQNLRELFGIESFASRFDSEAGALESRIETTEDQSLAYSPGDETQVASDLEASFDENPHDVGTAAALINHYLHNLELEPARDIMHLALAQNPTAVPLLLLAGKIAHNLKQQNQARVNYEKALGLEPENVEALLGLGQVLRDLSMLEDALKPIEKAVAVEENSNTLSQLTFAQVNACHYEEALATCDKLETLYPHVTPFLQSSRAVCHAYLGEFDKAMTFLHGAEQIEPLNPGFAVFRGMFQLQHENYEEGWKGYRYRTFTDSKHVRLLPFPKWAGEDLHEKTILVMAEQGLGDQVMFSSCLPDLLRMNPRQIILEAHQRVEKTLARSFPDIMVYPSKQSGFDWLPQDTTPDYYVPIADLASLFRRSKEDFPMHHGYLRADPERVSFWKSRLAGLGQGPKIGFSWRGGLQQTRRAVRSLELEKLNKVLGMPAVHFISLQYGEVKDELRSYVADRNLTIANWPEAISDLDEFAALISALDLVITVCNTTVHYAGALGIPCWIMTPYVPEWRYGIDSPTMRWYPSTRMYRQQHPGDWAGVLDSVTQALQRNSWHKSS